MKDKTIWLRLIFILAVLTLFIVIWHSSSKPTVALPAPVDGIPCEEMQNNYHIHVHLSIYQDGKPITIPALVGSPDGNCFYWLHTHDDTGVIHIEAPESKKFTLGNFFDIWGKKLSNYSVDTYSDGKPIRIYVDQKPYTGDPNSIVFKPHMLICLEVGPTFVDPPSYTFQPGL